MDIITTLQELGGLYDDEEGKTHVDCGVLTGRPDDMGGLAWWTASLLREWVRLIDDPELRELVRHSVACGNWVSDEGIVVVGRSPGGNTLAYEIARQLGGYSVCTSPIYASGCCLECGGMGDVKKTMNSTAKTCEHCGGSGLRHESVGQTLRVGSIRPESFVVVVNDVLSSDEEAQDTYEAVLKEADQREALTLPFFLCLLDTRPMTVPVDADADTARRPLLVRGGKKRVDVVSLAVTNVWEMSEDVGEDDEG